LGHIEDLLNGTCGLSMQSRARCWWLDARKRFARVLYYWLTTSASVSSKAAAWPRHKKAETGAYRPLVTLRKAHKIREKRNWTIQSI